MKLAVVTHKKCWRSSDETGYCTDGGFPVQMSAISEIFDETTLLVPCVVETVPSGLSPLNGKNLVILPLSVPAGTGPRRKLGMLFWMVRNGPQVWRQIQRSDAVHAPIPGDIGTVGMVFGLIQRKPLIVRHCGNWDVNVTNAEVFWRWFMERFAGGRNVMFATGGAAIPPSSRNSNIKWIFSTSLTEEQIRESRPRLFPRDGNLRLVIACRQEAKKGTEIVLESMRAIRAVFPKATLDVLGDGSLLPYLKNRASDLGIANSVTFHGRLSNERVVEFFKQSHIFCYPTSASEGFPKVVLEALASGLPVVSTPVSVLASLIGPDNGVLLQNASAKALSEAVISIATNETTFTRMSAKAIETAQSYSIEQWQLAIQKALLQSWKLSTLTTNSCRAERAQAQS